MKKIREDMKLMEIDSLKNCIRNNGYVNEMSATELFAGADLVITYSKSSLRNIENYEGDIIVETNFARALSWLVYKLKVIFQSELDYLNKYYFYPEIGRIANNYLQSDNVTEQGLLLYVVDNIENINL